MPARSRTFALLLAGPILACSTSSDTPDGSLTPDGAVVCPTGVAFPMPMSSLPTGKPWRPTRRSATSPLPGNVATQRTRASQTPGPVPAGAKGGNASSHRREVADAIH